MVATSILGSILMFMLWKKWKRKNPKVVVEALYIYPVKSCKGFEVNNWKICKFGLQHDREWMIYNPKTKRFVSQREVSKLALIEVELLMDGNQNVNGIKLAAPNCKAIEIEMNQNKNDKIENVTLWEDKVCGIDEGNEASKWLTDYISNGREYRLLRILPSDYKRATDPMYTPDHLKAQSNASYADGFPYLIVTQCSLDAVNNALVKRGAAPIKMNRFRPNIVIKTDLNEPFIEDRIDKLTLTPNKITFFLIKPCSRCRIPTICQETAIPNKEHEPTMTLRTFRSGKHLKYEGRESVYFGMKAVHNNFEENAMISKGDSLKCYLK